MRLVNNLVFANLIYRDYSDEFVNVGDTVNIRRPASFTSHDFVADSSQVVVQTVTESNISVVMNRHRDISFEVTAKDLTLSVTEFGERLIQPAIEAHAQAIDADIAALYKDIPYRTGTAGVTPAALSAISAARKQLNVLKAPMANRRLVIDPDAEASLLTLDAVVNAEKSGSTAALREASLGRLLGLDTYMSQNVPHHTTGGDDCAIDQASGDGGYPAGTTTIHVDGLSASCAVGDLLTIGGDPYVVTAVANYSAGDEDLTIYPALTAAVANDAPVTVIASHTANLAFHPRAFALVTRPLAKPLGLQASQVEVINWQGIAVRVTYTYNSTTKKDMVSLDLLYGLKTLQPELACRLLG